MDQLVIKANTRSKAGKGIAKKLRAEGRLPAVMYNSKGEAVMLDIDESEFTKVWNQATPTTLINLDVDGSVKKAFIKDTEYNIIQDRNLHVDFHVIDEDKPLIKQIDIPKIKTYNDIIDEYESNEEECAVISAEELEKALEIAFKDGDTVYLYSKGFDEFIE